MADRISSLPNEVIFHILSFLLTEEAVATSVLSKRWRPLWALVPVVHYDNRTETYFYEDKPSYCFERLIYATLLARNVQQPIATFRLNYEVLDDERALADINVWVNAALQRGGLENLEIELHFDYYREEINSLRSNIFTCKTLVVLKLKEVRLPACSSADLPSLKSLQLETVNFKEPQYFLDLLFGCPILEDLNASLLEYDHEDHVSKEQVINLPKLVKADLRSVGLGCMDYHGTNILVKAISNVEFLTMEEDDQVGVDVDNMVAEFPHLRHLHLDITRPSVKNSHWVFLMLNNCPKLQSLKLGGSFEAEDVLPYPDFVPECLSSCLTQCYLKCYRGTESDLHLAKYILLNSTYLKSMKIPGFPPNTLEVLKELAMCPKESASCEFSFAL